MSVTPVALQIGESVDGPPSLPTPVQPPLHCLVGDTRSASSCEFATEAERLGIRVVRTSGDITDFWFQELAERWRTAPVAIGGLTEHGPLFCLERLGWDHGLRVVFRGTHRELEGGFVEHAIAGPFPTIAAVHTDLAGPEWPRRLARLLNSCPSARDTSATTVRGVSAEGPGRAGHHGDALVSWVIAPKARGERS